MKNIKMLARETEIAKYKKQAASKKIDASLQVTLLDEIKKGNRDAIPKLVDSREYVIIRIIQSQIDNKSVSIEKMFNAGREALTTLAERELGSTGRERFFRFGAWWVRQAIIEVLA